MVEPRDSRRLNQTFVAVLRWFVYPARTLYPAVGIKMQVKFVIARLFSQSIVILLLSEWYITPLL